ncbi:hypothetical protein [Promicromonospora sp. NPDC050249]|uniref:hypothetical protein n=1 Tax=Promicromonospora sp. NPDC050249 TaxID=3154743 RepID=UPI0033E68C4B
MRQTVRDARDPAVGAPTDAWSFALPAGWVRLPTEAGVVYLPTEPVAGMSVPAAMTEIEIFGEVGRDPIDVATSALGDGYEETAPTGLDGRPGVRVARTLRGTPGEEPHAAAEGTGRSAVTTRQVAYVVSRDDADGDWLVLSFSTTYDAGRSDGRAEQLADVLVEFFDAVMTTFRWTGPGAGPVNLPERTIPGSA